jgi:hypothetical protein
MTTLAETTDRQQILDAIVVGSLAGFIAESG